MSASITAAAPPAAPDRARVRLESVDLLRGIVMIIMALDHVRDFFGNYALNPTDLTTTTVPLFLTRWITHLCAPTFFLLTGVGSRLSLQSKSTAELSRFLVTRGLWLVFLDAVVVRCLGMQFNFDYRVTILNVLWALGWSMVGLSVLVRFSPRVPLIFGVVLILGHNLLDGIPAAALGIFAPLWTVLHAGGFLLPGPDHMMLVGYPVIPWVGVTALGYSLGEIFSWDGETRRSHLLKVGAALILGFVLVRGANIYGDPSPWKTQATPLQTFLSFLNTSKYPPSLSFLLMTLGPSLYLLGLLDRGTPRLLRPALTFGRVPLFYFVVHLTLIHALAVVACSLRYGEVHWMFESPSLDKFPFTQPPDWPSSLPMVYVWWVAVVAMLYPMSVWFSGLKRRRRDWWLSYL
jgi:uncharacterized membrane protein